MSRVGAHHLARLALVTLVSLLTNQQRVIASEFPERECCDPIYPIPEPTSRAPSAPTPTGRSVASALPPQKIIGGSEAELGDYPYQVSLRYGKKHFCGGAIISESHIITAAHCVVDIDPRYLRIATGSVSFTGGEIHEVKEVVRHKKYQPGNVGSPYDIAIITLKDEIKFNKNQNKIDLPTEETPAHVNAVSTGWGYLNPLLRNTPSTLMKIDLKTLTNSECEMHFGRGTEIFENQLCTFSGRGRGTCQGDSGGPLAYGGHLVGLVSYGVPCAVGKPDVYTSVYHHLSWINKVMKRA